MTDTDVLCSLAAIKGKRKVSCWFVYTDSNFNLRGCNGLLSMARNINMEGRSLPAKANVGDLYVATAHKPTAVHHASLGSFTSAQDTDLIVA